MTLSSWLSIYEGSFEDDFIFGAVSNLSVIDGAALKNESFKNNDGVMEMLLLRKPGSRTQAKEALNVFRDGRADHPDPDIAYQKGLVYLRL